jgi:hypothetical protein
VGPFTAIWYAVFMVPFFLWVKEPKMTAQPLHIGRAMASLRGLLASLRYRRSLSAYLASSLFYRDALNALYGFGGVYASGVLGWSIIQIGTFGVVGAVSAMVAAWIGGRADRAYGPKPVIAFSIVVLILVCAGDRRDGPRQPVRDADGPGLGHGGPDLLCLRRADRGGGGHGAGGQPHDDGAPHHPRPGDRRLSACSPCRARSPAFCRPR